MNAIRFRKKSTTIAIAFGMLLIAGSFAVFQSAAYRERKSHANSPYAENVNSLASDRKLSGSEKRKPSKTRQVDGTIDDIEKTFSLIGDNGYITSEALRVAGLKQEDASKISEIIDEVWAEASEGMKMRAVRSKNGEDDSGTVTFEVRADQAGADVHLAKLESKFKLAFGENTAKVLLSGLHSWRYFGDFGRMDLRVTYGTHPDAPSMSTEDLALYGLDVPVLQVRQIDPKTGEVKSQAQYNDKEQMQQFMGGFPGFMERELANSKGE